MRIAFVPLVVGLMATVADAGDRPRNEDIVRVACVGDSITFGSGVEDREMNAYPAVLGRVLGDGYEVRNFGVSGTTAQKKGDHPYWDVVAFKEASSFAPAVVVIKLGTNDSKPQNWRDADSYAADLRALVDHFQKLPQRPRVFLCAPVPVHKDAFGIRETIVRDEILPAVRQVAEQADAPFIDLYAALKDAPEAFPDGVHPDAAGAKRIATTVAEAIRTDSDESNAPQAP